MCPAEILRGAWLTTVRHCWLYNCGMGAAENGSGRGNILLACRRASLTRSTVFASISVAFDEAPSKASPAALRYARH